MRVVIQENYEKMCLWAAHYIAEKIKAWKNPPFVLGLPRSEERRVGKEC